MSARRRRPTRATRRTAPKRRERRKSHYDTKDRSECFDYIWFPQLPRADRPQSKARINVIFSKTPGNTYWYPIRWEQWLRWREARSLGKYYNRNVKGSRGNF